MEPATGYQSAILARLAGHVYTVERHQQLAYGAATCLQQLQLENVSIYVGDGSLGWPLEAPYDRVLVTAAAPEVPRRLLEQLAPEGLLVIPVGAADKQELLVFQRVANDFQRTSLGNCVFVPLIGEEGWHEPVGQDSE